MALMTSGLAEGGSGADTFVLSGSLKGGSIYGGAAGGSGDGADLMSIAGGISAGAVYGNQGDDSLVVFAIPRRQPSLVVQVMTPSPSVVLPHPLLMKVVLMQTPCLLVAL